MLLRCLWVRPMHALVFDALIRNDTGKLRQLLSSGEASVVDVD